MIKASDAIRVARSLIGTPYAELDCINLIKKVIRTAPGGVPGYTTAGTNALWNSYGMSAKYKDLTIRYGSLVQARAGMIAFKADGDDFHHAGIVTADGTVIHSSSTQGGRGVVETPLTAGEGWTHVSVHRYIDTEEDMQTLYYAQINLNDPASTLNVRNAPSGDVIATLHHGDVVQVLAEKSGWAYVRHADGSGYVSAQYIVKTDKEPEWNKPAAQESTLTIVDSAGNRFNPVGDFRVLLGSVD